MDYAVHGVAKNWTRLSDCHFTSLPTSRQTPRGRTQHHLPILLPEGSRQEHYIHTRSYTENRERLQVLVILKCLLLLSR